MSFAHLSPMLATCGTVAGDPAVFGWDAWRAVAYVDGGVRVRTRTGREVSESLPELDGLADALDGRSAILDGELVACPDGRPDFYALGPRMAHVGRRARWAACWTSTASAQASCSRRWRRPKANMPPTSGGSGGRLPVSRPTHKALSQRKHVPAVTNW